MNLTEAIKIRLKDSIDFAADSIVSKELLDNEYGSLTLFAFDAGQKVSEHSAPFDVAALVIEGEALFIVGGKEYLAVEGETVFMPADIPHSVHARKKFKMFLVMIKK